MSVPSLLQLSRIHRGWGVGLATTGGLRRFTAAKKPGASLNPEDFKVEEDAEKLCKYVCINYFVEPKDTVNHGPKILPDTEYPEWLFKMDIETRRELEDMDPEKDGSRYWNEWMSRKVQQQKRYLHLKYRHLHLQECPTWKKYAPYSKWNYTER